MSKLRPWTWKNVRLERRTEEELTRAFLLGLYRAYVQSEPRDVEILMELGNLYTLTGQVENGLEIDKKLVEIKPAEPIFHYNLACSHSLMKEVDSALHSLEQAVKLGYSNLDFLKEDSDLDNVRGDERFTRLLLRLSSFLESEEVQ